MYTVGPALNVAALPCLWHMVHVFMPHQRVWTCVKPYITSSAIGQTHIQLASSQGCSVAQINCVWVSFWLVGDDTRGKSQTRRETWAHTVLNPQNLWLVCPVLPFTFASWDILWKHYFFSSYECNDFVSEAGYSWYTWIQNGFARCLHFQEKHAHALTHIIPTQFICCTLMSRGSLRPHHAAVTSVLDSGKVRSTGTNC